MGKVTLQSLVLQGLNRYPDNNKKNMEENIHHSTVF